MRHLAFIKQSCWVESHLRKWDLFCKHPLWNLKKICLTSVIIMEKENESQNTLYITSTFFIPPFSKALRQPPAFMSHKREPSFLKQITMWNVELAFPRDFTCVKHGEICVLRGSGGLMGSLPSLLSPHICQNASKENHQRPTLCRCVEEMLQKRKSG